MSKPFLITYNGVTKTVAEWGEEYNQPPERIYKRIKKHGWTAKRAFETPPRKAEKFNYKGKMYTAKELAELNGDISECAMMFRIRRWNGSIEKCVETRNLKPSFRHPELRKKKKGKPEYCTDPDCSKCPYSECAW